MTFHPYCFLLSEGNEVFHSARGVALLSSTSYGGHKNDIKGLGTYMYDANMRRAIALLCARSLIQQGWVVDQDRYIGEPK